jgi:superfamily I DNA/RNA helicase
MAETWWVKPDQLDDDQKEVVKLPGEGSYLIQGPPGSGKTNLLLLRANYISLKEKPNILILTFTRTLREFIAMGGEQYSFPLNKIQTHIAWSCDFLRMNGVIPDDNTKFPVFRQNLCQQIHELISGENIQNCYDAILLDEAQDYLPDEIKAFHCLSDTIFAVADSHQRIYQIDSPLDILQDIVDKTIDLKAHYRNGRKICRLAEEVLQKSINGDIHFMSSSSQYDEEARPSTVERIHCTSFEEQCEKIIKSLLLQIRAYPDELLGVICPTNDDLDNIWERINHSELAEYAVKQSSSTGYEGFTSKTRICVSTIHSAKGLEFRTLHIPCMENLWGAKLEKNICFTAITRAKTSLAVYHIGPIRGYLEKALMLVNTDPLDPVPEPNFEQIFGGN